MRVLKSTTPRRVYSSDKWQRDEIVIKPSHHHEGLFYWCSYWRHWDKVLRTNVGGFQVEVVECDLNGEPVGSPRLHCTGMPPAMFADRPFQPTHD